MRSRKKKKSLTMRKGNQTIKRKVEEEKRK